MFLAQWVVYSTLTHCIYSKIGLMVVELSIYKDGHEGLLNNLEDGLIILDQKTKELKFVNRAAKRYINKRPLNSTSIEGFPDSTDDNFTLDWQKNMFALVPANFFQDAFADVVKAVNKVKALHDYISLDKIL